MCRCAQDTLHWLPTIYHPLFIGWNESKTTVWKLFQVRIKVIEGRHISGRNINPVVRVTVGGIKEQTQVKYTTNQPYYNQVKL
jgi:hypothetical protein